MPETGYTVKIEIDPTVTDGIPRSAMSTVANDMIYVGAHALETEDTIVYSNRRGNSIGGLVDGTEYVVIRLAEDPATTDRRTSPSGFSWRETEQKAIDGHIVDQGPDERHHSNSGQQQGLRRGRCQCCAGNTITLANPAVFRLWRRLLAARSDLRTRPGGGLPRRQTRRSPAWSMARPTTSLSAPTSTI
jgi:hypothetical protein